MTKWKIPPEGGHMDKPSKIYFQTMTKTDVEERLKKDDILVIPVGSTENHGAGGPYGEDTFMVTRVAEELAKAKEKMLREREIALRENNFWLNILSNTYYLKDGDFSEFGSYNEIVNSLTVDSVKKAFKKYFNFENYVSVALEPAE